MGHGKPHLVQVQAVPARQQCRAPAVRGLGNGSRARADGQPSAQRNGRHRLATAKRDRTRLIDACSHGRLTREGGPPAISDISAEKGSGRARVGRRQFDGSRSSPQGSRRQNSLSQGDPCQFSLVFARELAKIPPCSSRGPCRPSRSRKRANLARCCVAARSRSQQVRGCGSQARGAPETGAVGGWRDGRLCVPFGEARKRPMPSKSR